MRVFDLLSQIERYLWTNTIEWCSFVIRLCITFELIIYRIINKCIYICLKVRIKLRRTVVGMRKWLSLKVTINHIHKWEIELHSRTHEYTCRNELLSSLQEPGSTGYIRGRTRNVLFDSLSIRINETFATSFFHPHICRRSSVCRNSLFMRAAAENIRERRKDVSSRRESTAPTDSLSLSSADSRPFCHCHPLDFRSSKRACLFFYNRIERIDQPRVDDVVSGHRKRSSIRLLSTRT